MEECESTDYWATTYPGQTVFVSIITEYSHCSFNTRKDVRLVDEVSAKLFIHSSCGRNENGGALVQKKNNGGTGIRMRMNNENENMDGKDEKYPIKKSGDEQASSQTKTLSAVICICTLAGFLIVAL